MNMIAIFVTLFVVFMLVLVITNLFFRSRNAGDFYHSPYDAPPQDNYSGSSSHVHTQGHERGDWGSRDLSPEHHDSGHDGGFDGGGDSGGDAGGGAGGGGGE